MTGKVRYTTRTVRASKAVAAVALRELVASAQAGPAFGGQASVSTLLDAWIAAKELADPMVEEHVARDEVDR